MPETPKPRPTPKMMPKRSPAAVAPTVRFDDQNARAAKPRPIPRPKPTPRPAPNRQPGPKPTSKAGVERDKKATFTYAEIESLLKGDGITAKAAYDFVFVVDRQNPKFVELRSTVFEQLSAHPHLAREAIDYAVWIGKVAPLAVKVGTKANGVETEQTEDGRFPVTITTSISGFPCKQETKSPSKKRGTQLAALGILGQVAGAPLPESMFVEAAIVLPPATTHHSRTPVGQLEALNGKENVARDLVAETGPDHAKQFTIRVTHKATDGTKYSAEATSNAKGRAEKAAAQQILADLGHEIDGGFGR